MKYKANRSDEYDLWFWVCERDGRRTSYRSDYLSHILNVEVPEPTEGMELHISAEVTVVKPKRIPEVAGWYKMEGLFKPVVVYVNNCGEFHFSGNDTAYDEEEAGQRDYRFTGPIDLEAIR